MNCFHVVLRRGAADCDTRSYGEYHGAKRFLGFTLVIGNMTLFDSDLWFEFASFRVVDWIRPMESISASHGVTILSDVCGR